MRRINIGLALILVLATAAPVFAQTIWVDGTGDWFNAANWSAGVPISNTTGRISNGGHAQIAASGAMGVASLGFGSQDSGTLSATGSGRLDGGVDVGVDGTGVLNITNGGVVTSGRFVMADHAGSHGTANVSGPGSKWTNSVVCFVGFLGTATLSITNGGEVSDSSASVGESNGSVGLVMVDGAGSVWTHSGDVTVAGDGTGTLVVTNGGSVLIKDLGFGSVIGRNPGSNGVVTISEAGLAWTSQGSLGVGQGFSGAGTNGALHIAEGGTVSNAAGFLGGFGGSTGTATVDGMGSTWVNSGKLYLPGGNGGSGMLTITQGGVVSNSTGYLGFGSASSTGTVDVNGAGSTWTNSANLYVGGDENGMAGVGVLRIQNGGTVGASSTTVWALGALEIGANPILNSALTFSGGTLRPISNTAFSHNASLVAGGVVVDSNGFITTLSGVFSGAGGLTKTGAGTISLTNTSAYTGATFVNAGRLLVNGLITGSAVTVNNPGSVLGGTGTISAPVVVNGSAALLGGNGTTAGGSLTVANNLALNSASIIQLVLGPSGTHSTLSRSAGTWTLRP